MNKTTNATQATKDAKFFAAGEATRKANATKAAALAKIEAENCAKNIEAIKQAEQTIILSNGTDTKTFVFDTVAKSFTALEKKLVVKYDKDGNVASAYAHLEKVFTAKTADNKLGELTDAINAHNATITASKENGKTKKSSNASTSGIAFTVPQLAIDFENLTSSPTRIITAMKEIENKKSEINALEANLKELEALKAKLASLTAEELETMKSIAEAATEKAKSEAAEKIKAERLFEKTASNLEELTKEQARKMLEKLTAMLKA